MFKVSSKKEVDMHEIGLQVTYNHKKEHKQEREAQSRLAVPPVL